MTTVTAEVLASTTDVDHRRRLLHALSDAIGEQGLGATTITDIVTRAGVSKRTFYEHFASKDDCFLALYDAQATAIATTLRADEEALIEFVCSGQTPDLETIVTDAVERYFDLVASDPALARTHFVEVYGLGDRGLAARRSVLDTYVRTIRDGLDAFDPTLAARLDDTRLIALVGGINELALHALERNVNARTLHADGAAGFVRHLLERNTP